MITSLEKLFIEQIRDLNNAEKQQRNAMVYFVEKAINWELKLVVRMHMRETEEQIVRLEEVCHRMDTTAMGEESEAMHGLIKAGYELMDRSRGQEVLDAGIIATLQYIEHFEIAGYGIACAFANELKLGEVAEQLHRTLLEEKRFDLRLSEIARTQVNKSATPQVIA